MREIDENIELKFYEVLKHKIDLRDFESWVYKTKDLENILPNDIYVDLISLNFNSKYAHNDLENLIGHLVDNGKFEIKRLTKYLESIIARDSNCADSIEMTYHLYCSGYAFLQRLALTYGLLVSCPPSGNYEKSWDEISKSEQKSLLDEFYPEIILDARNVLDWIENGKIIIRNSVNDLGDYEYDDLRNTIERNQGNVEVIDLDKNRNSRAKSILSKIKNIFK